MCREQRGGRAHERRVRSSTLQVHHDERAEWRAVETASSVEHFWPLCKLVGVQRGGRENLMYCMTSSLKHFMRMEEQAKAMERRVSLSLLCVLVCVGTQSAHTQGYTQGPEDYTPDSIVFPHFTGCRSREQETFRCWWSAGSFSNLSEPGALAVFFQRKNLMPTDWQECPEYTATVENECYFNKTFTQIWTSYCVQLRAAAQNITYDEKCFTVENIVHPDPPVALNWTLLNVSRSGLNFDILVRWAPPPSADVQTGWMSLKYEVHYRVTNASHWDKLDLESGTQQSIYGLKTNKEYEIQVRCKMSAFDNFGEFSESVFVLVTSIPTKESVFPKAVLLVFGVVGLLILLILIIFSQQQRLMVILLPPVPAPKIKGIDPDLLKNGKMDQLNSLLSSQHMYNHDTYREDPWVEFIHLDMDDAGEKNGNSDTQRLLGLSRPGLKGDDDIGRTSCYDPDFLPDTEGLLTAHSDMEERHPLVSESSLSTPNPEGTETPFFLVQAQPVGQSWINMDFYAQVSDVTPAGAVVLSPGQQNDTPSKNPADKKKKEEKEADKEEENEKKMKLQLVVVDSDRGSSPDVVTRQAESSAPYCSAPEIPYHTFHPEPAMEHQGWHCGYLAPDGEAQMAYFLPEAPPASPLPPVSDYTVVQEVDGQRSLLLNPSAPQSPACPPNPTKYLSSMPAMPMGYLTPELMENLSP